MAPRPNIHLTIRNRALPFSAAVLGFFVLWYLVQGVAFRDNTMGQKEPVTGYTYEVIPGFFLQDDPATDAATFDYTKSNFGLIDRSYETDDENAAQLTQWERFERYVLHLVRSSPSEITYKVIFNGRHGEGTHNVAEAYYGTKAWDDYWSKLDGNGTSFWSDAHLTAKGEEQALEAHAFYGEQLAWAKTPAPESYYVSPLFRCLQTANLTFSLLKLPGDRPFKPVLKEMLREVMGEHTCDRRSNRTVLHDAFPEWTIEPGFSEEDELWEADHRETHAEHDIRTVRLLDEIFAHDASTFISLTSHSGAIASLLRVTKHRTFVLPTGALIPLLVKATRKR